MSRTRFGVPRKDGQLQFCQDNDQLVSTADHDDSAVVVSPSSVVISLRSPLKAVGMSADGKQQIGQAGAFTP